MSDISSDKELVFSPQADAALTDLEGRGGQLHDRVNAALDLIEENPGSSHARKRRYHIGGKRRWAVPVHGEGKDWVIFWSEDDEDLVVAYIGPDPQ